MSQECVVLQDKKAVGGLFSHWHAMLAVLPLNRPVQRLPAGFYSREGRYFTNT
jgi:hypothetical protein